MNTKVFEMGLLTTLLCGSRGLGGGGGGGREALIPVFAHFLGAGAGNHGILLIFSCSLMS